LPDRSDKDRLTTDYDIVPDYLRPGLTAVFIGFNPGLVSGLTHRHYAGPGNAFWRLLDDSGLARGLTPGTDYRLMEFGFGLTNVVFRATGEASQVTRDEQKAGALALKAKLEYHKPLVACFTGKGAYAWARGKSPARIAFGRQGDSIVADVIDFVVPSPSGRATIPYATKLAHFVEFRHLLYSLGAPAAITR